MERNVKEEIYEAYLVLQDMHDCFEEFKYFDKDLTDRGLKSLRKLSEWETENKDLREILDYTIKLLSCQLDLSEELKCKKEEVWNNYRHGAIQTARNKQTTLD